MKTQNIPLKKEETQAYEILPSCSGVSAFCISDIVLFRDF